MDTKPRTSLEVANPNALRQLTASIVTGVPTDLPANLAKYWLTHTDVLHRKLRALLHDDSGEDLRGVPYTIDKYCIAIYYHNTVEKLLERVGFRSCGEVSSKNFSEVFSTNKSNVDVYLLKFPNNEDTPSKESILCYLKRNGLRPATLKELLSFAIYLREKTGDLGYYFLKGYFVASGSEWRSPRGLVTPELSWGKNLRSINLSFWSSLSPDSTFLGLRI